jgi:hypothetical protein
LLYLPWAIYTVVWMIFWTKLAWVGFESKFKNNSVIKKGSFKKVVRTWRHKNFKAYME